MSRQDEQRPRDGDPPPREGDFFRDLVASMTDGFALVELELDDDGRPRDWRFVETSPAFEKQTGVAGAAGRLASAVGALPFPPLLDRFAEIARSGKPSGLLHLVEATGRWLDIRAFRLGSGSPPRLGLLVADITERRLEETAWQDSEARFRQVADALPHIVWITDANGRPVFLNKRWFEYTGAARTPEDLAILTADHLHPDDGAPTLARFAEARASGAPFEAEHRICGGDGTYRWFLARGEPDRDETGAIRRWVGGSMDIHDRKLAEDALAVSEERLRLILENARDYAIFLTDPDDVITDWWAGSETVFGWSAAEAIGRSGALIYTEEDRKSGVPSQEIETAIRNGIGPDIRWHRRKDGSRVFIEGSVTALRGRDGRLAGFLKIGRDVTERRAAEEALRRSEARFREFGEAASDLLWIMNAETQRFEYLSPAAVPLLGLDREPLMTGRATLWSLMHPDDRARVGAHLERVRDGERDTCAFRIYRASDGELRWISDTGFPLRDNGRVSRIAGIAADITEEQETRDRLRILVAELHHRTRNLLAVVQAVAERTLTASASLDDFRARFYPRLAALARVNELLSRLEANERVTFDQLLRVELSAHGALETDNRDRIVLEGPPGTRLRSSQIQTFALALHELCTNSLKYGALARPDGRLLLRWEERLDPDGERHLVFTWQEKGLAAAPGPAGPGRGFGRELIERALPRQLRTAVDYRIDTDGVRCVITVPLSARSSRDGASS